MPIIWNHDNAGRTDVDDRTAVDLPLCILYFVQPEIEMHCHDFLEFVCVAHGSALHKRFTEERGATSHIIRKGDVFLIPRGEMHGYYQAHDFELYNILFHEELLGGDFQAFASLPVLKDFFSGNPDFQPHLPPHRFAELEQILEKISMELLHPQCGSILAAKNAFAQLLLFLSRAEYIDGQTGGITEDAVGKAVQFMKDHFMEDITLEDISHAACMSRTYFSGKFKQAIGVTPWDYIFGLRMNKAKLLLAASDCPIKEIAFRCGFPDSSYFTRLFRKQEGVTPRQFRETHSRMKHSPEPH